MTALSHDFNHKRRIRSSNAIQRELNATITDNSLDLLSPGFVVRFRIAENMIRSKLLQPFFSLGQVWSASVFRRSEDG